MSVFRKRRVRLPSGKTIEVAEQRPTPPLYCDICAATFNSSRPFLLDGAPCYRCDVGVMRPSRELERGVQLEAAEGVRQIERWLQS